MSLHLGFFIPFALFCLKFFTHNYHFVSFGETIFFLFQIFLHWASFLLSNFALMLSINMVNWYFFHPNLTNVIIKRSPLPSLNFFKLRHIALKCIFCTILQLSNLFWLIHCQNMQYCSRWVTKILFPFVYNKNRQLLPFSSKRFSTSIFFWRASLISTIFSSIISFCHLWLSLLSFVHSRCTYWCLLVSLMSEFLLRHYWSQAHEAKQW